VADRGPEPDHLSDGVDDEGADAHAKRDADKIKRRLEVALSERDDARKLVHDLKRFMDGALEK